MNTISVHTSRNYDVLIGDGILSKIGHYASTVCRAQTVAVISDTNVWSLYGKTVLSSLQSAGYACCHFTITPGESEKNGDSFLRILNFLAENQMTRSDLIVALGGGVVGDIAGFAAATYLRGICYIQVPTTLLAMVDASVGGKTAIDLPSGKNLVGTFYQPSVVLCDLNVLSTLPESIFRDGCAEIIKYAVLFDSALFEQLESMGLDFDRESVISRCIELKRNIVDCDEFDTGIRHLLNFGHTVGHCIEVLGDYKISHGQAVAAGMAITTQATYRCNLCSEDTANRITSLIERFNLPTSTTYSAQELCKRTLLDKKRTGTDIKLVIPLQIGTCEIKTFPVAELQAFIEAGI